MDPVTVAVTVTASIAIFLDVSDEIARTFARGIKLRRVYGLFPGIGLVIFGNRTTWKNQAQILGQLKDEDAMTFKKTVQDECTMISVAAAIVAQIAITGLSLDTLSQTHWVARACFVLSLTSSLMAVYYASTQQRVTGRLLQAKHVRNWIRGGRRKLNDQNERIVPSWPQLVDIVRRFYRARRQRRARRDPEGAAPRPGAIPEPVQGVNLVAVLLYGIRVDNQASDPEDFDPGELNGAYLKLAVIRQCFTPSLSSVITMSAPQILLSLSLFTLLIGLGVYFGFVWTRNLDTNAGHNDSRNVFIVYIVGLALSIFVYSISRFYLDKDKRSELAILEENFDNYVAAHPEIAERWGIAAEIVADNSSDTAKEQNDRGGG